MPYKIVKEDGKFIVKKKEDDKLIGTHESRDGAKQQIAAIYANTKEAYCSTIMSLIKRAELNPAEALQLVASADNIKDVRQRSYDEILKDKLWNFILPAVLEKSMLVEGDLKVDKKEGGSFIEDDLQNKLQQYFTNRLLTENLTDADPRVLEYMAQLQRLNELNYLNKTPKGDMTADDIINILGGAQM